MLHFPLHLICSIYWIDLQDCSSQLLCSFPGLFHENFYPRDATHCFGNEQLKIKALVIPFAPSIEWHSTWCQKYPPFLNLDQVNVGQRPLEEKFGQIFWNRSTYLFCEGWFIQYWSLEIRGSGGIVGQKSNSHERLDTREAGRVGPGDMARSAANRIVFRSARTS